ncbi:MAG: DNA alkylation repair protein [Candidatus Binataceae bacterium]
MPNQSDELARYVTTQLKRLAEPAKAPAMAAYMKTSQPFFGVPTPTRAAMFKRMGDQFAPLDQRSYSRSVLALWKLPHREEQYCAISFASQHEQFITPASLPLYERMIREGAWWDFVDDIAVNLVGAVYGNFRAQTRPMIERWIDDEDLWIRRTALLSHLKHKRATNKVQLFRHCLKCAHEPEFFIRKAIGWALRECSKTDPDAVRKFLATNRERLSKLSFDEGSKHIARAGSI